MKRQYFFVIIVAFLVTFALMSCMPAMEVPPEPNPPVENKPLSLVLEETQAYVYTMFSATVTSTDPDIDSIQLWKKREGTDQWIKIYGENWFAMSNSRYVFQVNVGNFEVGTYTLRAQGLGDSARSSEKQLTVLPVVVTPQISVNLDGTNITNNCFVGATDTLTATFSVDVDFHSEKLKSIFDELYWKFEFSGAQDIEREQTLTPATFESTKVVLELATECTKHSTLTILATANGSSYTNTSTFDFTLDMKNPQVLINNFTISENTDFATVVISASDTKSLDKATLSFFADKGIQGLGWEEQTVNWGTEYIYIGTGDKEIVGKCAYSTPQLNSSVNEAVATVTFTLSQLDGITLMATASFEDKADFGSNHSANATDSVFYDNIYHRIDAMNLTIPVYEGVYVLTKATSTAALKLSFVDAFNNENSAAGTFSIISSNGALLSTAINTSDSSRTLLDICTGYATKIVWDSTVTISAPAESAEGTACITIIATDTNGNYKTREIPFVVDTLHPQLASVDGHMAYGQGAEDDYVNFAFRNEDAAQGITFEGATVIINENVNNSNYYYNNGIDIVQLNNPNQFKLNFNSLSYALTDGGNVTVKILVKDKYGNEGMTEFTGNVSNP